MTGGLYVVPPDTREDEAREFPERQIGYETPTHRDAEQESDDAPTPEQIRAMARWAGRDAMWTERLSRIEWKQDRNYAATLVVIVIFAVHMGLQILGLLQVFFGLSGAK